MVLIAFDACIGMGIIGEGSLSWCDWAQEKKVRWVKMLYDVGNGIWSGQGLHAVESRVEELERWAHCVLWKGSSSGFLVRRVGQCVEENVLLG